MARVNRTTGFFLLLGVVVLIGTVTGARLMLEPGEAPPTAPTQPAETSVHASGNVDLLAGLPNLVPGVPGKVKEILVKEGDEVKTGQPLVQLDDNQAREQLKIAEQALKTARARLNDAKSNAEKQIKEYELKVVQAQGVLAQAKVAHEVAYKEFKQAQTLAESKLSAGADIQLHRAESQVLLARNSMETAEAALTKVKSIDPRLSVTEHEEALKEADLRVKAATEQLNAFVIKAPADGEVYEINYQVGGSAPLPPTDLNAGRALVFRPNGDPIVRAEIDQEWAMMVKPGLKVTLTYRTNRGELTWTGKVERVSKYLQRRRPGIAGAATFADARTRECIIRIDPNPKQEVFVGMPMSVQIHLK